MNIVNIITYRERKKENINLSIIMKTMTGILFSNQLFYSEILLHINTALDGKNRLVAFLLHSECE